MKAKIFVILIFLLSSSDVFAVAAPVCYAANINEGNYAGQPSRTFSKKNSDKRTVNINFKAELFAITKHSSALTENVPYYRVDFSGNIDTAPGGNKFWDLVSNAEIIDEIDNGIGVDVQTASAFKGYNYYKPVFLSVLGQNVSASEFYYLDEGKLYAKGMSIAAQSVTNSGTTITLPAQEVLYIPSKLVCNFPLTYDGTTHANPPYNQTIIASVTGASAMGIPDGTPVSYSVAFNDSYKVLAWGGLQLVDNEKPINALLVQSESKTVGTVYINGVKASQEVLSPLKLIQDAPETFTTYSFRDIAYPDNVAEFGLDGNKVTYLTSIKTVK